MAIPSQQITLVISLPTPIPIPIQLAPGPLRILHSMAISFPAPTEQDRTELRRNCKGPFLAYSTARTVM